MASPVVAVSAQSVFQIAGVIRYFFSGGWIGIEIVIDVDCIHIVPVHNIIDYLAYEISVLLICRVKKNLSVILEKALGFHPGDMA